MYIFNKQSYKIHVCTFSSVLMNFMMNLFILIRGFLSYSYFISVLAFFVNFYDFCFMLDFAYLSFTLDINKIL